MLALIAVLLAGLLGMAAMTVDLGHATMQQQRLEGFADASATMALREEARLRFALAQDASLLSRLGCQDTDNAAAREACILAWVQSSSGVAAVYDAVLPRESDRDIGQSNADVALGPPLPQGCGAFCWRTEALQRIPLLFGQGSNLGFEEGSFQAMMEARERGELLAEANSQTPPSLRSQGIPIKADSKAETRPVVRVGLNPDPNNENSLIPGRAPFALRLAVWSQVSPGGGFILLEDGSGALLRQNDPDPAPAGRRLGNREALRAGENLGNGPTDNVDWSAREDAAGAYVPLFVETATPGQELVVGFGFAKVEVQETLQTITVTRLESQLAPGNATASPRLWVSGSTEITQRISEVLALRGDNSDLLQAPVLQ